MSILLYKHNQEAYKRVLDMFQHENRVAVLQPTGTGKSFLYLKWIEDNPTDKIYVLSPSTEIFSQMERYAAETGDLSILENVEFITYQGLLVMSDEEIAELQVKRIVLDEFHRTGAEQWGAKVHTLLNAFQSAQVFGATATPVRYLDGGRNMADEIFNGNIASYMMLGQAVARGILPMPKYVPVYYDVDGGIEAQKRKSAARFKNAGARKEYEDKVDGLRRQLEHSFGAEVMFKENMPTNHGKYLVFCRNAEHVETMKETMREWLRGVNENVHMYTSLAGQDDDNHELHAFMADDSHKAVKLLFSVDRFNEGVHVPGIDGVIMLRPTDSPIIYLQQMGRALASGSKHTPVIFDLVNNFESVQIDGENVFERDFVAHASGAQKKSFEEFRIMRRELGFESLWSQLADVIEFDNEAIWNRKLELYKEFKKEFGRAPFAKEVYAGECIGAWCNNQKTLRACGKLSDARLKKLMDAGFDFSVLASRWEHMFGLYVKFKQEFGHEPTAIEVYDGENLGDWCIKQRSVFSKGKLSNERYEQLLAVGFDFTGKFDRFAARWEFMLELYVAFKEEFGREPSRLEVYMGEKLGEWCNTQKRAYSAGSLPDSRVQRLMDVGFVFSDKGDVRWDVMFKLCVEYKQESGLEPPQRVVYRGENLGRWYSKQREAYSDGKLPIERLHKLIAAGFDFTSQAEKDVARWKFMLDLYVRYKQEFGREPAKSTVYEGERLGQWCNKQKADYSKGKLSDERYERLLEAGFPFKKTEKELVGHVDGLLAAAEGQSQKSVGDEQCTQHEDKEFC